MVEIVQTVKKNSWKWSDHRRIECVWRVKGCVGEECG